MEGRGPSPQERARRQSAGLLALAGLALLGTLVAGVWLLTTLSGDDPELDAYATPSPSGGSFVVAYGDALGAAWSVDLAADPSGPSLRLVAGGREVLRRDGLVPTVEQPVVGDGAARERDGRRVVVLFGTVAPGVGSIEVRSDGRAARLVVVETPRALQLNVRLFVAVLETTEPITVRVQDRDGRVLSEGVLDEPLSAGF